MERCMLFKIAFRESWTLSKTPAFTSSSRDAPNIHIDALSNLCEVDWENRALYETARMLTGQRTNIRSVLIKSVLDLWISKYSLPVRKLRRSGIMIWPLIHTNLNNSTPGHQKSVIMRNNVWQSWWRTSPQEIAAPNLSGRSLMRVCSISKLDSGGTRWLWPVQRR